MKKLPILLLLLLFACSSNNAKKPSIAQRVEKADKYFAEERYNRAKEIYQEIVFERNSSYTAHAQWQLAMCFFNQEKYSDAVYEFNEFLRLFPDHQNVGDAYYYLGYCNYKESEPSQYTQDETIKAIEYFGVFLEKYSSNPHRADAIKYTNECNAKMLQKNYENGYIYYMMSDYSSALMYFDEIIELGNADEIDKLSLYYSAKIFLFRKDQANTEKYLAKMEERHARSEELSELKRHYKKVFHE